MNSFTKDLIAVLKSRVTVIGSGILTSIITARYLGPNGNGIVAALTVYPDLFMTIGSLGIRQAAAFYVGQKKYDDKDIFSSILSVWLFTSTICIVTCYILLKYVTKGNYESNLILLALIPIPFSLFITYSSGYFLGKNKIQEFNTVNWVPNLVKLLGSALLIVLIPLHVEGAMIAITSGYVLMALFVFNKLKHLIKIKLIFDSNIINIIKELLSLGVIYALAALIINLNYKVDIMLLERFSTNTEVGLYTKGTSIVEHLWDIPTLISTIIFARSATAEDPKAFSYKVCQLLRICFLIILAISVVFYFLSETIMVSMYGIEFKLSSEVQKILIPGILLLTIFKVLYMDLAGKGKPTIAIMAMIPSLIINILLNWKWDNEYGARGAALASTISYSISAIIFLIMYSRFVKIPLKEIISYKKTDFSFIKSTYYKITKNSNYLYILNIYLKFRKY